jgi:hypothetical protein
LASSLCFERDIGLELGSAERLHLGRWDVAERFVPAVMVEPADVLDDGELELRATAPDAVGDELGLGAVDEDPGQRVVVGIADRPDRGEDAVVGQGLGVDAVYCPNSRSRRNTGLSVSRR